MRPPLDNTTIRGELTDFTIRGSDFWGVGHVRTLHDGGDVTITGKVLGAHVGDTVELDGTFTTHPQYGKQLKVKSCRVVLPSDATGVVAWLAAKLPQVSRRRAEELVELYGIEGLWAVLEARELDKLTAVKGITGERAEDICAAYEQHKSDRDRMVRFKEWGLTDSQIARVIEEWDDEAEEKIIENPYRLIDAVKGFGWTRADAVALRMGVRRDAPPRVAAGLRHVMQEAAQAGHCFVPMGKLVNTVQTKVCEIQNEPLVREQLHTLIEQRKLVQLEQNIYLPHLAAAERSLARLLARAKLDKDAA
jgi:exodeoxyribonuclease V alpha subunit